MRLLMLLAGCATVIPLVDQSGVPVTLTPGDAVPLEIITRKNVTVKEPLPLRGRSLAFGQVEAALGHAVASGVAPWMERHPSQRWQLDVELIAASARAHGPEVTVSLDVRATLRARAGNRYLAQTQSHCQESAIAGPSTVMFACMSHVGRVLGGWLGGIEP
jgi:hypothetical protein